MSSLLQDDLTKIFHPVLTIILDEAFGSIQYLQCFDHVVVGLSLEQDIEPSTSHCIPYQMAARHVPNQANRSSREDKRCNRYGLYDAQVEQGTMADHYAYTTHDSAQIPSSTSIDSVYDAYAFFAMHTDTRSYACVLYWI